MSLFMCSILEKPGCLGWLLPLDQRKTGTASTSQAPHSAHHKTAHKVMVIPPFSLCIQPINWDQIQSRGTSPVHPHPCLIHLSVLNKQATCSVGTSTETKTFNFLLRRHLAVICFLPAARFDAFCCLSYLSGFHSLFFINGQRVSTSSVYKMH